VIGGIQDGGEVAALLLACPLTLSLVRTFINHEEDGSFSGGLGFSDSGGLGFSGSIRSSFRGARSCLLADGKFFSLARPVLPVPVLKNATVCAMAPARLGVSPLPLCVGERTSADPFIVAFFRRVAKSNPELRSLWSSTPIHLHGCCVIGSIHDGGEVATLLLAFNLTGSLGEVLVSQEVMGCHGGSGSNRGA